MGFDYVVEGKIMCAPKESLGGNQPIIRGGHDDCGGWGGGCDDAERLAYCEIPFSVCSEVNVNSQVRLDRPRFPVSPQFGSHRSIPNNDFLLPKCYGDRMGRTPLISGLPCPLWVIKDSQI